VFFGIIQTAGNIEAVATLCDVVQNRSKDDAFGTPRSKFRTPRTGPGWAMFRRNLGARHSP